MNRKPLAPAPSSVINVAPTNMRTHSRATSHAGSGVYTEMRAQIRKEREHEKLQRSLEQGISASNNEDDLSSRRQPAPRSQSQAPLSASTSDYKVGQLPSSEDDPRPDPSSDKDRHLRVLAPTSSAMSSDNASNMSTGSSQMSSFSSTGVVRKRSQTVSTGGYQPSHAHPSQAQMQVHASYHQQHEQARYRQQEPFRAASRTGHHSCTQSPAAAPEELIGIDALQTAFSTKYYELANKCKNWETYAAKLRAHIGVLEAENRVLKEQNSDLERDNAHLQALLRQEERSRTQMQGRMNSLEDCLSQRNAFEAHLDAQYRALEMLDYDHLSLPSAPSSVEKNNDSAAAESLTPYCSSNLQIEDRSELRPQAMPTYQNGQASLRTATQAIHPQQDPVQTQSLRKKGASVEAMHSKWDSPHAGGPNHFAADSGANIEGRSSRLGTRSEAPTTRVAHQRSGTVGAFGMLGLRSGSVMGGSQGHLKQAGMEAFARPASAQQFCSTHLESNATTTAASIVAGVGVTKAALQSKRRSTASSDRGPSLSLAQIVKGALTASGVVAPQSRQTSPNDKIMSTSDYLQECVEKRREAMRSSFSAQQKGITPATGQAGHSRPVSRAGSRLSTQSGTRARSRAGSVHDAIPVAVEDVFCNQRTFQAHSAEPSPELLTQQLAEACLDSQADISAASHRLMAATETHAQSVQLMTRKELSIASSPGSFIATTPASSLREHTATEREIYLQCRQEMNAEEFQKFERCIQRYDWSEIPLEGNRGLITRVKRILLVSDPDLRTKHDKLRRRQQLARDFEKMAKKFGQRKPPQPTS